MMTFTGGTPGSANNARAAEALERTLEIKARLERRRQLADQARAARLPGETLAAAVRRLQQEAAETPLSVVRTSSGLLPTEQQVMELWDAGSSIEQIAERLGKGRYHVLDIVRRYAHRRDNDNDNARTGSGELLAAIRRHHPEAFAGSAR